MKLLHFPSMFMNFPLILLSLFHLLLADEISSVRPVCHSNESLALLQLKESLISSRNACRDPFDYPKVESWKLHGKGGDCCSWDGVECDETTGHVVGLNLSSSCLYGSINSSNSLFQLVHLQMLDLSNNDFNYSEIPSAISYLSRLTFLRLSDSLFYGQIPSQLSQLSNLSVLDLSNNQFTGKVNSSLSNLTQLVVLVLSGNNFVPGTLSWVGKLKNLNKLYCQGINLNGDIPSSFANLTKLSILELSHNQLTGEIPPWLMKLKNLTRLHLSSNSFNGSIPTTISELGNLAYLDLAANHFTGTVDMDMFLNLRNLTLLLLSSNNLSLILKPSLNFVQKFHVLGFGSCNLTKFPSFLQNQNELQWLDLSNNNIRGLIPKWILNISKESLEYLNLGHNYLTGFEQSPLLLPWSALKIMNLRSNNLQGSIPIPPPSIEVYMLNDNELTGEIPKSICSLNLLDTLDLSYNNLSGLLPPCLNNFSNSLTYLKLRKNHFYGTIPLAFTRESSLKMFDLSQNQFQGQIPRSLANCTILEYVDLSSNQINDTFPFWLGNLRNLTILVLRANQLHGAIRSPGFETNNNGFPSLQIIDLSHNDFSGALHSSYFQSWNAMKFVDTEELAYMKERKSLRMESCGWINDFHYSFTLMNKGTETQYDKINEYLTVIDLSSNRLEGEIPESIGKLQGLYSLNLSHNILTGHIVPSLGNITMLESLDLSYNELSGEIPQELKQLKSLSSFDVSYNHLRGIIPQGEQFDTFDTPSFDGNPELCGKQLSKRCGGSESSPTSTAIEQNEGSNFKFELDWRIVMVGFSTGIAVGVGIGYWFTTWKHSWFVKHFGRNH